MFPEKAWRKMEQAADFRAECVALHALLTQLDEKKLGTETRFKRWTFEDIIRHLAVWDTAACLTLADGAAFRRFFSPVSLHMKRNSLRIFEKEALPQSGPALVDYWYRNALATADLYASADPKQRLKWGGPDLSARTCITSRLMETWSHSQAIYDELGVVRKDDDRIKNIAQIGVQTFEWSFLNRGISPPGPIPRLELSAPSGAIWIWGAQGSEIIEGSGTEFCQVITQTRNVADTRIRCSGPVGAAWMAIAQCFAGPPSDPPPPGERRTLRSPNIGGGDLR